LLGSDRFQIERTLDSALNDNVNLIHRVDEFQPDLLFVLKGEPFLPETLATVKKRLKGPMIHWSGDNPFWFPNIVGSFGIYDHFFVADEHYVDKVLEHGGHNVSYLAHAVDEEVYSEDIEPSSQKCDVIFVGDSRHQMGHLPENWRRVEFVEAVAGIGCNLAIYGRGWDKLPQEYDLHASVRAETLLPATRVAAAYKSSSIVLNVHHAQMVDGTNMRTFEAGALGAFQLVDQRKSLNSLFNPPEDIVCYSSVSNLVELVSHYLNNPKERLLIAEKTKKAVLNKHTYRKRMNEVLGLVVGDAS
tara:strand:- start:1138 stop:2043 length:906 start_codon:yes stop_codon:yes gene_type:complete